MDKYEKKVRVNQIISCIRNGEYQDAQEIADTIDWRQEKSIRTLRMVSEVYKINRRYDDALTVLNLAYEKDPEDPIKRKIVYDLCELSIKMGQFGLAVRYMKEFSALAPRDPGRYILQYRLLKATDADYGERIELLEEFKSRHFGDFDGKWAYELAYLYHMTGQGEKCVECCNEISLWFVTGPVVAKALRLKKEHQELTYEEEQKIASDASYDPDEEVLYQKKHHTDTAPVYLNTAPVIGDGYSTADIDANNNYQQQYVPEQYPAGMNQPYDVMPELQGLNIEVKKVDASSAPTMRMAEKKTGPSIMSRETTVLPDITKSAPVREPEPVPVQQTPPSPFQTMPMEEAYPVTEPEPVKPAAAAIPGVADALTQTGTIAQQEISVNLDKYSTMNLQAELRENMEKLQEETGEPLREKEEKLPERVAEPDRDLTELKPEPAEERDPDIISESETLDKEENDPAQHLTADGQVDLTEEDIASKISSVPVPDQIKNMISQEYDGQLQLNIPAETPVSEKQITGQMDIDGILAEWDKLQEEAKERRIRAAKKKSLEQTNELAKKLASVLPGYELPKVEEEPEKDTGIPERNIPEKTEVPEQQTSAFTAPLVVPENVTAEVDTAEIENRLETIAEAEYPEDDIEQTAEEETAAEPEDVEPGERKSHEKRHSRVEKKAQAEEPPKRNPKFATFDTVELPSVFDSFRNIKGLPRQLKDAEEALSMEASHGNVLIMGSEHAARMELIQAIVRDMRERETIHDVKAATIDADVFNNKDVIKSIKALSGNILVIEGAGRLSDDSVITLISALSDEEEDILVILEDSRGGAKGLNEYDGFESVFDVLIDIPTLTNDYLVDHAKGYASDQGYTLDDMAVLALYQRIDERQTSDHVVTSDEVEHIIDSAIKRANKKNLKHLGDVLLGKRYNDDDLIVLREKDFAK